MHTFPPPSPPCQTRRSTYFSKMPMASGTKDGTKHLPGGAQRPSGGHSVVQVHGTIEKSQHPELHPSTTGSTPIPSKILTVLFISITQSLSRPSKNDPHLEDLTISIAMGQYRVAHRQRVYPLASSCDECYSPPLDHMPTGTDSLVLGHFNAQHSLGNSRNNRYKRQPNGGFNQHFQY